MDRVFEFVSNHWIMVSMLLIVTVLLIQDLIDGLTRNYKLVTATAAVGLLSQEDSLILDVREPHEWAKGHVENAVHIPLGKLAERIHELETHKATPVVVMCQSGTRSIEACKTLAKAGFTQIYNLGGGMMEWEEAKLPVTNKKSKK